MISKVLQLSSSIVGSNKSQSIAGVWHTFDGVTNRFVRQGGSKQLTIQNLQDLIAKAESVEESQKFGDPFICFRSTDLQLQDALSREQFFQEPHKFIAFNRHFPWLIQSNKNGGQLQEEEQSQQKNNADFVLYFDEGISDVICSKEQFEPSRLEKQRTIFMRIGGGFDYGFFSAYNKLELYLDLKNDEGFEGNSVKRSLTSVEQIALLSGFQSWSEIESRNMGEKRVAALASMSAELVFEIELFMKEIRERIFIAEPIKKKRHRLQAHVNLEFKREIAREFETWMYSQIAKNVSVLRNEFEKVERNRVCRILVTGRMANNPSFRRIVEGIAEKERIEVTWQKAGYQELVAAYIRDSFTAKDAIENFQEIKCFKNVSYGFNERLGSIIQKQNIFNQKQILL